jgi:ATP-binding cassette subfamily B protein
MKERVSRILDKVRRQLRRKYPTVRQYDRTDCGPAALLSVLRYHGGDASLVFVRHLSHTGVQGTSMAALHDAAITLGFEAAGARGSYADLEHVSLPCIAHLVLDDGRPHFVVVYRVINGNVLIGDPARGLHWAAEASFCLLWKSRAVLLLSPTKRMHNAPTPHWVKWVLGYFRQEETWLTQALFIGFCYAGLGLLTALFVRSLIDRFIPTGNVRDIVVVGICLLTLQVVRALVGYLRSWLLIELNRRVNTRITVDALSHLFRLPASFFESRRTGDITSRINDSVRIHAALLSVLGNAAIDIVVVAGSISILFYLAPMFGWMALASVAVLCTFVRAAARQVRDRQFETKQAHASVQASYIVFIGAIDPIRGTNSVATFGKLLGNMYEHMQRLLARLGMVQTRVSTAVDLTAGGMVVVALTVGSLLVVRETSTLGVLMAGYSLLAGALPATARIFESYLQLQEASVASTRLLDLMLVDPEQNEGEEPFQMSFGISIRGGKFHWQGGTPLLESIHMDIQRGRMTALCGPSGVGKSTLVKILDRRYRLHGGEMLVDNTAVDRIELSAYRHHVSTLPESVSLLNGTIAENILLGREVTDVRELLDRIELLGLAGFMSRFSSGVHTLLGDEGRQISSGERQAIGLLRALYDLPDVLLVDEGINAVDAETAQVFFKTLRSYANDHAVLVVSHNSRTLLAADYVYLMQNGTIVEQGPPTELLARDSEFTTMISTEKNIARSAFTCIPDEGGRCFC